MQNIQKLMNVGVLLTEVSHVFCCVLPTLFSVSTFFVTLGAISAMPVFLITVHDTIHGWEIPIISASGLMLVLGWAMHYYSVALDCRSTGCVHEPCKPAKKRSSKLLKVATILFLVNVSIYFAVHRGQVLEGDAAHFAHESQHAHVHAH